MGSGLTVHQKIWHKLCVRVDTDKTCLGAAGGQNIGKMWNKICEIGTKLEIGSCVGLISFQQIFSLQDDPVPFSISDPIERIRNISTIKWQQRKNLDINSAIISFATLCIIYCLQVWNIHTELCATEFNTLHITYLELPAF